MVDIIVPFVDSSDPIWQESFDSYKSSNGARGVARFRDMGTFKYFFRSVEKNCPWVRYVFLVVQSESQIPKFLNRNHPKLKIVFHKDYIPENMLPTFNSNVIEMNYHRISELSDNFILCNDDMFFTGELHEYDFFQNGRPVGKINIKERNYRKGSAAGIFANTLYNTIKFFNNVMGTHQMIRYSDWHIPLAYSKILWKEVWDKHKIALNFSLKDSRFRMPKNIMHWVFAYIQYWKKLTIHRDDYFVGGYMSLNDETKLSQIINAMETHKMVCLNDEVSKNDNAFITACAALNHFFPLKCSFENGYDPEKDTYKPKEEKVKEEKVKEMPIVEKKVVAPVPIKQEKKEIKPSVKKVEPAKKEIEKVSVKDRVVAFQFKKEFKPENAIPKVKVKIPEKPPKPHIVVEKRISDTETNRTNAYNEFFSKIVKNYCSEEKIVVKDIAPLEKEIKIIEDTQTNRTIAYNNFLKDMPL